jgi:hypothetical protein
MRLCRTSIGVCVCVCVCVCVTQRDVCVCVDVGVFAVCPTVCLPVRHVRVSVCIRQYPTLSPARAFSNEEDAALQARLDRLRQDQRCVCVLVCMLVCMRACVLVCVRACSFHHDRADEHAQGGGRAS